MFCITWSRSAGVFLTPNYMVRFVGCALLHFDSTERLTRDTLMISRSSLLLTRSKNNRMRIRRRYLENAQ